MAKRDVLSRIEATGIIPVVRVDTGDEALAAVAALLAGGIRIAEITMTVPGALSIIEQVAARSSSECVIAAGTVLDSETARAAILRGAQLIVCPSTSIETIRCCRRYGVAVMPGALTPTEVLTAREAGADLIKVFPCGPVGGPAYIRALRGPFPDTPLVPMGGVTLENAAEFLAAGATALGVESALVDPRVLKTGDTSELTRRARQLVDIVSAHRRGSSPT